MVFTEKQRGKCALSAGFIAILILLTSPQVVAGSYTDYENSEFAPAETYLFKETAFRDWSEIHFNYTAVANVIVYFFLTTSAPTYSQSDVLYNQTIGKTNISFDWAVQSPIALYFWVTNPNITIRANVSWWFSTYSIGGEGIAGPSAVFVVGMIFTGGLVVACFQIRRSKKQQRAGIVTTG